KWRANLRYQRRLQRIIQTYHGKARIAKDVSVSTNDGDSSCSVQRTLRIERQGAFEEVVSRISVEQGADAGTPAFHIRIANDHETFFFIGDKKKTVDQMNGLLFVLRAMSTQRIDT